LKANVVHYCTNETKIRIIERATENIAYISDSSCKPEKLTGTRLQANAC